MESRISGAPSPRRGLGFIALSAALLMGQGCVGPRLVDEGLVPVDEVEIHYRVFGDGEPLLLLHGFTNAGQVWDPYIDRFANEYSLIIPDLRGHGLSTNPTGEFTHRMGAQDMLGLLDTLGIERCKAIGHSSGAIVLLEMAVLQPGRLEAMVLVDGTHRFPDETRDALKAVDVDGWATSMPWFLEAVVSWHPGGMNQLRALGAQARAFGADPQDGNLTTAELARIRTRTLVVHGDRDDLYPVGLAVELYEALPDAGLWVMPHTGHEAVFVYRYAPASERCIGCEAVDRVFPTVLMQFLEGQ